MLRSCRRPGVATRRSLPGGGRLGRAGTPPTVTGWGAPPRRARRGGPSPVNHEVHRRPDRPRRHGRVKAGPGRLAFRLFCSGVPPVLLGPPPWRWATLIDMLDQRRGQTAPSAGALGVPGWFAPFLDIGAPPNGGVAERRSSATVAPQRLIDRGGSYGSRLVSSGDRDAGRARPPLTCTGGAL